jgi:hypothetical protein
MDSAATASRKNAILMEMYEIAGDTPGAGAQLLAYVMEQSYFSIKNAMYEY